MADEGDAGACQTPFGGGVHGMATLPVWMSVGMAGMTTRFGVAAVFLTMHG